MRRITEDEFQSRIIKDGRGFRASGYKGSTTKLKWECTTGHSWLAAPDTVLNGKFGCKECFVIRLKGGSNTPSVITEDEFQSRIIKDGRGFRASGYKGSLIDIGWECRLGHSWIASPSNVLTQNSNCPTCSKSQFKFSEDEFQNRILLDGRGYTSSGYISAHVKVMWTCNNCHQWRASPDSVLYEKSGCPYCNTGGFNPNRRSILYLYNFGNDRFGYGITGDFKNRCITHSKNLAKGDLPDCIEFTVEGDGPLIKSIESKIILVMSTLGYNINMRVDGFRREAFKTKQALEIFHIIINEETK